MRFLLVVMALSLGLMAKSQDKIYKAGGQMILAKVQEIGTDEIKYKLFDDPDGPTYGIEKDRVVKIVFQNGRTETYRSGLKDPELYTGQQKQALKFSFLSPLSGHAYFQYEISLKPGRSLEFGLDIPGLGKNQTIDYLYVPPGSVQFKEVKRDAAGVGIGVGYKFIRTPDFLNRNIRYAHLLQGAYIKPNILMGLYGENILDDKTGTMVEDRRNVFYTALMVDLGKQWVFGESMLFDIYFGLGYSFDNIKDDYNVYSAYGNEGLAMHYTHLRFGSSPGFAMTGGLKIGLLLGKKRTN